MKARAYVALAAALLGMIVVPLAHTIGHRDDHVHGLAGDRAWPVRDAVADQPHDHGDVAHVHEHGLGLHLPDLDAVAVAEPEPVATTTTPSTTHVPTHEHVPAKSKRPPLRHGDGGLEHFAAALLAAFTLVVVPEPRTPIEVRPVFAPASVHVANVLLGEGQARAPPV